MKTSVGDTDDDGIDTNVRHKSHVISAWACCYMLLCKLNLHISSYTNLRCAYEYFMTLPCTEVAFQSVFET